MISVLYVDDEPALLELGKIFLEAGGEFTVDTLTSAEKALGLLKSIRYDAIISDYQMPGMDGIEFLKVLRGSGNTTPLIIFTGKSREEILIQALNEGADYYLQKGGELKPQFAELAHMIKLAVRKQQADRTIININRLYAVLSGVNNSVVLAKTHNELFLQICRIAVESGKFNMAWIGIVDTPRRMLNPVAHFGSEDGYLQSIRISTDDNLLVQSPGGRAVREGKHIICNSIFREPRMKLWYPEIEKRGYRSTGAFPFFIHTTIVGVLQLYSEEENFFDEEIIHLVNETVSGISFALKRFEAEEFGMETEINLKICEEKLAAVVAGSPVPQFIIDSNHCIVFWNRALEVTTGITAAQVFGTRDQWQAFYKTERPTMADILVDGTMARVHELYSGKISESEVIPGTYEVIDFFPHLGENGRWMKVMAVPIKNEQGVLIGAVETIIDTTAIRIEETGLRQSYETIAAAGEEIRQQFNEIIETKKRLCVSEERS
jgi:DNA-binding response OmpR family regulator